MADSKLIIQDRLHAFVDFLVNLKTVLRMKVHLDLNVCHTTAWFLWQRVRTVCVNNDFLVQYDGNVETD